MEQSEQGGIDAASSNDQLAPSVSFLEALFTGNCAAVEKLIKSGSVNINEAIDGGPTPLVLAIIKQDLSILSMLLRNKADPNLPCLRVVSGGIAVIGNIDAPTHPLTFAIETGNPIIVKMLLDHDVFPNLIPSGLKGIILLAVKCDCYDLVRYACVLWEIYSSEFDDPAQLLAEALDVAVTKQNLGIITLLVERGASLNREYERMLPLTKVANTGNITFCRELLQLGAHLDGSGTSTPLSCAISAGMERAVHVLISLGCSVNKQIKYSQYSDDGCRLAAKSSYLHLAIARRKFKAAKCLIEAKCNMNLKDIEGNTALHIATQDPTCPDAVEFLMQYALPQIKYFNGPNFGIPRTRKPPNGRIIGKVRQTCTTDCPGNIVMLNTRNLKGRTALMEAVLIQNVSAVNMLVEPCRMSGGLNITDNSGYSALHHAIEVDNEEMLLILLKGQIDVNAHHKPAYMPLHYAVQKQRTHMIPILIDYNANTSLPTPFAGNYLLHLAVEVNCLELVQFFLKQGHDVNAKNSKGQTPLLFASCGASHSITQALIDYGAKLNVTDYRQEGTALIQASIFGMERAAFILIKEGADTSIVDARGLSVIAWCLYNRRASILRLIVADGHPLTVAEFKSCHREEGYDEWILQKLQNARRLQELCRIYIRKLMQRQSQGTGIVRWLDCLPLPTRLKDYLCYRTVEDGLIQEEDSHDLFGFDRIHITDWAD